MADFEEAKQFLSKDENGTNVFDHITDLLANLLAERPNDPVAVFEQISARVKQGRFQGQDSTKPLFDKEDVGEFAATIAKLHQSQDDGDQEDASEPLPPPRADVLADLFSQRNAWSAAGVAIPETDLFKLQLSLARLAGADDSIETLRIWGKLQGRDADYFVAEGTGGAAEGDEADVPPEPEANRFTYWVCSFPGGPWTQLEPVRAEAILCARQIKRFLTGDLSATVLGYPQFPGPEKAFVRAIIALINADCALAPKGFFVENDDASGTSVDEEFQMPASAADLADAAAWEAFGLPFNSLGRVAPLESEDDEGNPVSQPEGWELKWLRSPDADQWTVRTHPSTLPDAKSAQVVLRSQLWPGAAAIATPSTATWTNIYVGYGYPASDTLYTPPMPPALQGEFDAATLKEQPDVVEDPEAEATEAKEE
ncbi:Radial spoke head protein 4 homolog A (Radial spoke head-like protein 3) [Durusdinium trenchii]|uniref:Radial spoke head protein 4 homolog A (Radial spoke head-like protein 3) n=1 Tax=Durusdinium trenchii TaxID=1381693 RepID=A0ABP0K3N3_9DINO